MVLKLRTARLKKPLSFIRLLPNVITISALVVGMNSIRFALDARWDLSVICIIIAAILDAADGRVARMLNATSVFGAELDSLSDFANFGIAPALMGYLWAYQRFEFKLFAWSAVLLFVICMVIRLARFNVGAANPNANPKLKQFFMGVPAPVGAVLFIVPIILDFDLAANFSFDVRSHIFIVTCYQIIIALLLPSRIYTFSLKSLEIKPEFVWAYLLGSAAIIIALIIYPWYVIPLVSVIYLLTIPLSMKAAMELE
jgi:CDP-diacylglycerol---serine O-phosphatidyltransferase